MVSQRWFTIHPKRPSFYNLEGKDNIVLFFTDRYVDQPLLIKGCGAEVTAWNF
jgi:aspartokinase/homoserine dehydrogenase 1